MTEQYQLTPEQLEQIRSLAYDKFLARGCEDGHDVADWIAAEQEVLAGTGTADGCATTTESCATKPARQSGKKAGKELATA